MTADSLDSAKKLRTAKIQKCRRILCLLSCVTWRGVVWCGVSRGLVPDHLGWILNTLANIPFSLLPFITFPSTTRLQADDDLDNPAVSKRQAARVSGGWRGR